MRAEIIAIGDELTTGQRLDTNTQWLAERLTDIGLEVAFHTTVADDLEANVAVFKAAAQRAEVVVSTGGLGPTADDLTREAMAAAAGVDLRLDPAQLAHIEQMFLSRGREMPQQNRRQAEFPQGALAIPNATGTAPGVQQTLERLHRPPCVLFALPGVPSEMRQMWRDSVRPALARLYPQPRTIRHRRLKCFGVGESHLEAMLPGMIDRGREPRVGITVSGATITLRVTAAGQTEAESHAAMAPTLLEIRQRLGVLVFGEEDDELQHAIVRLLAARGETVALSELLTAGTVAGWLADADPEGAVFVGGETPLRQPAADVAAQATACRERYGADYALAIGVETMLDGVSQAPIALADSHGVTVRHFPTLGSPAILKPRTGKLALNLLRLNLLDTGDG
ncbi:Putative competence-damage inducible protein [Pirellulimonas nuda]|uniref:CinA-like protein n=1 Tax=Pirellulimonas nuda TaxID=2528009 RepID=A0A518DGQ1_9BACT|nr:CinA family nicotinamide mononucleotide deamidase-related protein [Pirellulimonas nuda]QDU90651.1 Putative competence-damage inducible protein [Pirellulimonas nuda]